MITSADILEKTGIKNAKTLTRWHKGGIIPKPMIRTHPSGRGKIAYWPDWVLERCTKIVALQKQGFNLQAALIQLQIKEMNEAIANALDKPGWADTLRDKNIELEDGRKFDGFEVVEAIILSGVREISLSEDIYRVMSDKFQERRLTQTAVDLARGGYNPILIFDGADLGVVPDFLAGHLFSDDTSPLKSYFAVPLLSSIQTAFKAIGSPDFIRHPTVSPAPKVWVKQGDLMMEYLIYLSGPRGFEVIKETANTISQTHGEGNAHDE